SRRGSISLVARADDGTPQGAVFIPFCYYEAAANLLTNPVLDPFGKIPEFKYCAVRVGAGGGAPQTLGYDAPPPTSALCARRGWSIGHTRLKQSRELLGAVGQHRFGLCKTILKGCRSEGERMAAREVCGKFG